MLDYKKLINVHSLRDKEVSNLKQDFINQFDETLTSLNCDEEFIPTIASTVFSSMMSTRLYYHTPAHILNIFSFARENSITLTPIEELAILFHDAVYRPGSKMNEDNSVLLMESLLLNTNNIDEKDIRLSSTLIKSTGWHLQDDAIPDSSKLVMDLDMAGFANSPGEFASDSELVEKEFHRGYGSDVYSLEQFLNGRLKFLNALAARKTIYRTPFFLKKFEKRAQTNLRNAILEVTRRLESENVGR